MKFPVIILSSAKIWVNPIWDHVSHSGTSSSISSGNSLKYQWKTISRDWKHSCVGLRRTLKFEKGGVGRTSL